ncbi:hypothetical protein CEXT_536991 [Caerostris extrusa]|uniref:Uncharacterized protein n=1 Tax=Caerostris extrusa TaxID=172846 RepID=A0AAV4P1R4_CAEEX|nr:hypothetical protein CEXT_536991 [Caerostris extrusa]
MEAQSSPMAPPELHALLASIDSISHRSKKRGNSSTCSPEYVVYVTTVFVDYYVFPQPTNFLTSKKREDSLICSSPGVKIHFLVSAKCHVKQKFVAHAMLRFPLPRSPQDPREIIHMGGETLLPSIQISQFNGGPISPKLHSHLASINSISFEARRGKFVTVQQPWSKNLPGSHLYKVPREAKIWRASCCVSLFTESPHDPRKIIHLRVGGGQRSYLIQKECAGLFQFPDMHAVEGTEEMSAPCLSALLETEFLSRFIFLCWTKRGDIL